MQKYIHFDKMITPAIIKIIFWVGVGLCVLFGLISIGRGATAMFGGGLMVITGIITILVGPLLIRIYCELLIVLFKMHEALQKISDNMDRGGSL
jgi:hypothetical protein